MSEPMIRSRVRLPADVELEDKLAFGLTARQLLLLGGAAVLTYGLYTVASSALPLPVAAALCAPLAITGTVLALGRRDGLPADRLARLAVRYLIAPRRRLLAPEGIPAPLAGSPKRASTAAIDLLVCLCLFWILIRIPFWAKDLAFSGRRTMVGQAARTYVLARVGRKALFT